VIKLALEVPTPILWRFSAMQDLAFLLAHRLGSDRRYRSWALSEVLSGRETIVDNGLIELGTPWNIQSLYNLLYPLFTDEGRLPENMYITAPDQLFNGSFSRNNYIAATKKWASANWAYVVHGTDLIGREDEYNWAMDNGVKLIGFAFKEDRLDWLSTLIFSANQRYHLYGLADLEEIKMVKKLPGLWSVDTGKPFKMAHANRGWLNCRNIRWEIGREGLTSAQTGLAERYTSELRVLCA